jgi:hypothetical protein
MRRANAVLLSCALIVASLPVCGTADEPSDAANQRSYSLEFSGNGSCVIIPKLRYDGSHPLTLEAFATPVGRDDNPPRTCVLGNVELSGLAIHYRPDGWLFHVNDGREENRGYVTVASDAPPRLNTQVHVAAVYDGKNVRLFIDGKLQSDVDATIHPHKASPFDFMIGADPDPQGKPHQFFKGIIDEVRISKVARYQKTFTPSKVRFASDPSTLVLYHFDDGEGDTAKDSSDNKYDGQVQGAKWVKAME